MAKEITRAELGLEPAQDEAPVDVGIGALGAPTAKDLRAPSLIGQAPPEIDVGLGLGDLGPTAAPALSTERPGVPYPTGRQELSMSERAYHTRVSRELRLSRREARRINEKAGFVGPYSKEQEIPLTPVEHWWEDTKHNFWWLMKQIDRPRTGLQVAMQDLLSGKLDYPNATVAIGDMSSIYATREKPIGIAGGLLGSFGKGLVEHPNIRFMDIFDWSQSPIPGQKEAGEEEQGKWEAGGQAFLGGMLRGLDNNGPLFQLGMALPYMKAGVSPEMIRGFINFGGDMITDPSPLVAEGPARLAIKGGKVASTALANWARTMDETNTIGKVSRYLFVRGTGIPEVDNIIADKIDLRHYMDSDLRDKAEKISGMVKPLRPDHIAIATKLSEETSPEDAFGFIRAARKGIITEETVNQVTAGFKRFRNPEAIKNAIRLNKDEFVDTIQDAVSEIGGFRKELQLIRDAYGVHNPELGGQLVSNLNKIDRVLVKTIRNTMVQSAREQASKVASMESLVKGKQKMLAEMIGGEKMNQLRGFIVKNMKGDVLGELRNGKLDTDQLNKIMRDYLQQLHPGFVIGLENISKDQTAISNMSRSFQRAAMSDIISNEKIAELIAKRSHVLELMSRVPQWTAHIWSAEAMDRVAQLPSVGKFGGWLRTPRTASDMFRKFVEEGRPLSFEEIELLFKQSVAEGALPRVVKPDAALHEGMTRFVASKGPLYKARTFAQKGRRLVGLGEKTPREIADLFDTDLPTILHTMAQRTARSVSSADMWSEGARLFGKTPDELSKMGRSAGKYFPLGGEGPLRGGGSVIEMMHGLKGIHFTAEQGQALLKAHDLMVNPSMVLKYYDTMMSWWKAYQLPLFSAYHARNAIGGLLNMTYAGYLDDPRHWMSDIGSGILASRAQMHSFTNNITELDDVKFFIKAMNKEMDGSDFLNNALRHGIIDEGYFAAEIGNDMAKTASPAWTANKDFLAEATKNLWKVGSRKWTPVQVGTKVGKAIENQQRLTLYASRLARGDDFIHAAATVKKFLGDFRTEMMTPFERGFLMRMFPFYRWTRFNVPMQIEQLIVSSPNRMKMLALLRGQRDFFGERLSDDRLTLNSDDIPESTPTYIKELVPIPVKRSTETGEIGYMIGENFFPATDIDNFLNMRSFSRFAAQSLTPVLSKMLDYTWGRSPLFMRDFAGNHNEFLGKRWDSQTVNWLRSFRALNAMDTWDPFGKFHRVRERQKTSVEKALQLLGGITIETVNPYQAETYHQKEILDYLRRAINESKRYSKVEDEQ